VLLAGIKALARCPCPRCLMEKDKIWYLGTFADALRRGHKRYMTSTLRDAIISARKRIFELGRAVGSAVLHVLFNTKSFVPLQVCEPSSMLAALTHTHRTRFQHASVLLMLDSMHSAYLCRTSCMSLSWECGKRSTHISYACLTL
jgi:hypothetical protein